VARRLPNEKSDTRRRHSSRKIPLTAHVVPQRCATLSNGQKQFKCITANDRSQCTTARRGCTVWATQVFNFGDASVQFQRRECSIGATYSANGG